MNGLPELQDAFGQELYAYFTGESDAPEIVERDDGWIDISSGPHAYFSDYKDWSPMEKRASRHVRGRVLDIGAGAGRWSLHLQERGCEVVAIDNSPLAAEVCKRRGVNNALVCPISQVSGKLGRFDSILMMGNNFGLFGSFDGAKRLLERFHRLTSPRGRIVAQTLDPYRTENPDHLSYHERNRRRGRMGGQIRIRIRFRKTASPWFDYLFVSKEELAAILEGTDWRVRRFFDSAGPGYVMVLEKA